MEDVRSVEFGFKAVFREQIYSDELMFFSLLAVKVRTLIKVLLE